MYRKPGGITFGQKKKIVYQRFHPDGLILNIIDPFYLFPHQIVRMGCDNSDIGQNNSNGGFQLVRSICNKLTLLVPSLFCRTEGQLGQESGNKVEYAQGQGENK